MKKYLLALFAVLTLSGCFYETVYKNADRLALNRLEELVELNNEQTQFFLGSFSNFQVMHQKEHMPLYLRWLTVLEGNWRILSYAQIVSLSEDMQTHWSDLSLSISAPTTSLLHGLNTQQKADFIAALKKRAQERAKNTERLERALERFEDILGALTPSQQKLVTQYLDDTEYYREVWHLHTQKRIEKIESLLAVEQALNEQQKALLGGYVFNSIHDAPSHIKRVRAQWIEKQVKLMLDLRETLSLQQQDQVDQYIRKWTDVVKKLMDTKL